MQTLHFVVAAIFAALFSLWLVAGHHFTRAKFPGAWVACHVWAGDSSTVWGGVNAFTPQGETHFVVAWDAATGAPLWRGLTQAPIRVMRLDASGTRLAATQLGGNTPPHAVTLWDAQTGQMVWTHPMGHNPNDLAFSADGGTLLIAHEDGVRVLDARTGHERMFWSRDGKTTGIVSQIKVLPDGSTLLVQALSWGDGNGGSGEGGIALWDAATGQMIWLLAPDTGCIVDASPDGTRVVLAGHQSLTLTLKDVATGQSLDTARQIPPEDGLQLTKVRWVENARIEVDCQVWRVKETVQSRRWEWNLDADTFTEVHPPHPLWFATVSPDGRTGIVSNSGNGLVHPPLASLYDAHTGTKLRDFEGKAGW